MEVILNINDLKYEDIFNKVSLSIEKGKIATISGSNNSGKTTLCRILDRKIKDDFNINLKGKDIKDYSLEVYNNLIQVIYPTEIEFSENTLLKELQCQNIDKAKIDFLKKELGKMIDKNINRYSRKEIIISQISLSVCKCSELIVIDSLDYYLKKTDLDEVYDFIKKCVAKYKHAFLITTTNLEHSLLTDKLYIIKEGEIILQGDPLTVLQNDNIINKAGLNVPFMIDLSVKLRDYELIKDVILDKERLVDSLWN